MGIKSRFGKRARLLKFWANFLKMALLREQRKAPIKHMSWFLQAPVSAKLDMPRRPSRRCVPRPNEVCSNVRNDCRTFCEILSGRTSAVCSAEHILNCICEIRYRHETVSTVHQTPYWASLFHNQFFTSCRPTNSWQEQLYMFGVFCNPTNPYIVDELHLSVVRNALLTRSWCANVSTCDTHHIPCTVA